MGMGRMGMELGIAPRLLQSRGLGQFGKSLSSAKRLASSATGSLFQPSGLRWQLALSSAQLSASLSSGAGLQSSPARTCQTPGPPASSTSAASRQQAASPYP